MTPRPPKAPKLDRSAPCIEWDGELDRDGYGRSGNGRGSNQRAHRFVWEEDIGDIPEGLTLDHICLNRSCVNPQHLDLVTMSVNSKRRWGK